MRSITPLQAVKLAKDSQVVVDLAASDPRNELDAIAAIWPNQSSVECPDGIISVIGYWDQLRRDIAFEIVIRKVVTQEQANLTEAQNENRLSAKP